MVLVVLLLRALLNKVKSEGNGTNPGTGSEEEKYAEDEKPDREWIEIESVKKSLAESLKEHRTRCKMTQEYVAEALGRESSGRLEVGDGIVRPEYDESDRTGKAI